MPTHLGLRLCGVGLVLQAAPVTHEDKGVRFALLSAPLAQSRAPENASVPDHAPQVGVTELMASSEVPGTLFVQPRLAAYRGARIV